MIDSPNLPKSACNAETLLAKNEFFKHRFKKNKLFQLIEAGEISPTKNTDRFLYYLQIWAQHFQRAMLLKTALCEDPELKPIYQQHLREEFGHDELIKLQNRNETKVAKDAVLLALCNWFPSKMLSYNLYEQIVVMNLCLEGAANTFYPYAQPIMDPNKTVAYFNAHDEVDVEHEKMGLSFLQDLSQRQYRRLLQLQEDTWDMIEELLARIAILSTT